MERIDWKGVIVPRVSEIIGGYSYRPTLRQVFYRLVAALLIPNTEVTYKSLSRATVLAREQEIIDPLCFDDRIRTSSGGDYGYSNPDTFVQNAVSELRDAPSSYTRLMWESQAVLPIIWLEKDALFTPVNSIAERYRIKVYAARGYSSFTAVYQAAQEIDGYKPVRVLQLTDFDPSGEDMVRDLQTRLARYGAEDFEIEKIALTHDQVSDLGLPPMPAKTSDPRYDRFAESYGDNAVELDALPPDELERIVRDAITSLIDEPAWNAELTKATEERDDIQRQIDELLENLE
ncbi:hypothetical protein LCGC14_0921790 [marine sediment metagenome]|uniref:DUF2399 domain-containing protein n=1 Tax=marine sediment metagenome TaxID=412755 RepID=A0A0F9NVG3_9ZZZZ